MTYPTLEEIDQIAQEFSFYPYATNDELQAFATRMIEIGRKMQRESDAALFEGESSSDGYFAPRNISKAIRNNTGE